MKATKKTVTLLIAAALVLGVFLSGCMTERTPVDKTNDLGLDKKLFEGEWFYKQTVTDIPYSVDYTFIGETNELKIIRWEITEHWLYGWSIHDRIDITDTYGTPVHAKTPVITLPIIDHYDVQLAENDVTGEEMPMVVANRDKPWWQRRYFAIDPSSNVISPFDSKYMKLFFGLDQPATLTPVSGYRNLEFHDSLGEPIDPRDYEYRHASNDDSDDVDTMSFYAELLMNPNNYINWRYIDSWEDLEEFTNYDVARMELRYFFWRVKRDELANNGFEPLEFQEPMFRRFGYFVRRVRGYDPLTGYRENMIHEYAQYHNISGDNQIVYYLSPNYPEHLTLAACSIAADYNHAFTKAFYEGGKAEEAWDNGDGTGFISDFPQQAKLADGLHELAEADNMEDWLALDHSSMFMQDAYGKWELDGEGNPVLPLYSDEDAYNNASGLDKLKYKNYYYLDYNVESYQPPSSWNDENSNAYNPDAYQKFTDMQDKMVQAMKNYCFPTDEEERAERKFLLARNQPLEYSSIRDGVNPEGIPNLLTREEMVEIFGEQLDVIFQEPVDYPVACKLTLDHRCMRDGNGNKVPRYKYEPGDGRYSFLNWVNTPTEYGILGVAQWSDNPETGQIFGGVGNIAGSVLQWSVSRELERYFMMEDLEENGFDPTRKRYDQMLDDIIIDAEYTRWPGPGEEEEEPQDTPTERKRSGEFSNAQKDKMAERLSPAFQDGSALKAYYNFEDKEAQLADKSALYNKVAVEYGPDAVNKLKMMERKHLPKTRQNFDMSFIEGSMFERWMTPNSLLTYLYPDATTYGEDNLYMISPAYWGNYEAMAKAFNNETELLKGCYFQSEWLDAGFLEIIDQLADQGYTRDDIRQAVERIMFKGVAEHEIGHSIGLRHNFIASADELNYVGQNGENGKKVTGYWKFKKEAERTLEQKISEYAQEKGKAVTEVTPIEKFYLEKKLATPKDWYMYSSVMDYMDEFYYHGFGLGKYDIAAILYVYGKSVEKYQLDANNNVVYDLYGNPKVEVQPLMETRFCGDVPQYDVEIDEEAETEEERYLRTLTPQFQADIYNEQCQCIPGAPEPGFSDSDCVCTNRSGKVYCYNEKRVIKTLRWEPKGTFSEDALGKLKFEPDPKEVTAIQLNGDNKPYLFCTDHQRYDEPMCNVWDKGFTARRIIREMADQYKRFYFWRFFRRGNPKFKPLSFWYSVGRFMPFVHFALDYNYNRLRLDDWIPSILDDSIDPLPLDEDGVTVQIPKARKEYLLALRGQEEWTEYIQTENGVEAVKKTLTPGGVGDYMIAGMEGFNFLIYDIMYSPDATQHLMDSWIEDQDEKFFIENELTAELYDREALDIDLRYGHHHRNHWDYQDNVEIMQPRLMRRGFTEEKDAASFLISYTGFPSRKYNYESMANSFAYVSDGFDNAIYHMMADVIGEDQLYTFSRYCARMNNGKYELKVYQPRVNELWLWNFTEDWAQEKFDAIDGNVLWSEEQKEQEKEKLALQYPRPSDMSTNMCEKLSEQTGEKYYPVHASWIYFDKFYPALFTMYFQNNFLADNTAYEYYRTKVIPVSDRRNWAPPDEYEIECLSSNENYYYRARRVPGDSRPSPIYRLVERCHNLHQMCVLSENYDEEQWGEGLQGQVPGNLDLEGCVPPGANTLYPRWYIDMYLEHIESSFQILNAFAEMWNSW